MSAGAPVTRAVGPRPRTALRGWSLFAALFALLLAGGLLAPAASASTVGPRSGPAAPAAEPDPYDPKNIKVSIREAPLEHKASENHATMDIIVQKKDGTPPRVHYGVFLTFNQPGQDPKEAPINCQEEHYNSPEVPIGVYRCSGIITDKGLWEFHGTVNKPALRNQTVLTVVSATFNFPNAVKLKYNTAALQYVVTGKTFEVFLLQAHVVLAGAWLLLAASMAFLAIPRLRRMLSVLALHTLEVRRGFLVSSLWAMFAGTLGTGLYLLSTQTAYKAPYRLDGFSKRNWDRITQLPYAQDYFLLLYTKIIIFGVMAAASVLLVLEASRQAQISQDSESLEREAEDDMWGQGVHFDEEGNVLHDEVAVASGATEGAVTRTALRARRRESGAVAPGTRALWICAGILLVGSASIGACVTGLKYLHELIESTVAATVLGGGR